MATRYEVWLKQKMISGREIPEDIFYTVDTAIETAKKLSRGTYKALHWVCNPHNPFDGENVEAEFPNMYAVIVRSSEETTIRGWGIGGVWHYATNCKRCGNTGLDDNGFNCYSCKGASYKAIV